MEKVATDIYTFARLREEGFTYVDMTGVLHEIASGESGAQMIGMRKYDLGFPNREVQNSWKSRGMREEVRGKREEERGEMI